MNQILHRLSPRERSLVTLLLPILLLAVTYQFAWLPLRAKRADLLAEIVAYVQITDRVTALGQKAGQNTGLTLTDPTPLTPLSTRVTQSAESAGLALRRLEPEGEMLRVTLDEVAFASVMLWLSDLEVNQSVIVSTVEIDRRTAPGIVSVRLLLRGNQ